MFLCLFLAGTLIVCKLSTVSKISSVLAETITVHMQSETPTAVLVQNTPTAVHPPPTPSKTTTKTKSKTHSKTHSQSPTRSKSFSNSPLKAEDPSQSAVKQDPSFFGFNNTRHLGKVLQSYEDYSYEFYTLMYSFTVCMLCSMFGYHRHSKLKNIYKPRNTSEDF